MENASKALYLAASVLIGMMIMGIMIYLFRLGGSVGEKYDEKQNKEQLELFNARFENYYRDNNTISDIISVTNLARNINEDSSFDVTKAVSIDVILGSKTLSISSKNSIERNYLYIGKSDSVTTSSDKIYVYNLLDTNKKNLADNEGFNISSPSISIEEDDTLAKVQNEADEIIYKFLFKCTDIQYNELSGRVKYMKFEMYNNPKYY